MTTPPLTSLKVVAKPDMPADELWVHPAMMALLQQAFMEADTWRTFCRLQEPAGERAECRLTPLHDHA